MSWSTPAQTTNGQTVTAVFWNAQIPENFLAGLPDEVTVGTGNITLEADSTDPTVSTSTSAEFKVGPIQHVWFHFDGFTDVGSGTYYITLPVAASSHLTAVDHATTNQGQKVGAAWTVLVDEFASTLLRTSTQVWFAQATGGHSQYFDEAFPQTWDSSDILTGLLRYPVD